MSSQAVPFSLTTNPLHLALWGLRALPLSQVVRTPDSKHYPLDLCGILSELPRPPALSRELW